MVQYLGTVELGTLIKNGTEQSRPTKPWRISSEPYPGAGVGNIADFSTLQDMSKWIIGNTSSNAANRLKWHKIQDGNKILLICDRVILVNVSWDDLNGQNLILGKTIDIDGQKYKIRSLTGGAEKREGGAGTSYDGGKLPNEWDNYIVNEFNIAGIPVPNSTDLGSGPSSSQHSGAHNQFWNWMGVYSWCQETYLHDSAIRAGRGYDSARYWNFYSAMCRSDYLGWRPVLEILNSAPVISGKDSDLGSKSGTFTIKYQVSDSDGDNVNVTEKINDTVINTISSITQNTDIILSIPTNVWSGLTLGQHTVKIIADDGKGGVTTRTYTFKKVDDRIEFSLKNPIETSIAARRIVISGVFTIPEGSGLNIYVCNNAFDAEPTWENATDAFLEKQAHKFMNTTKTTEKWGVSVYVIFAKGTATSELSVNGFGIRFD